MLEGPSATSYEKKPLGCFGVLLAVCTCGLSLLLRRKTKVKSVSFKKIAFCKNCGHSWTIDAEHEETKPSKIKSRGWFAVLCVILVLGALGAFSQKGDQLPHQLETSFEHTKEPVATVTSTAAAIETATATATPAPTSIPVTEAPVSIPVPTSPSLPYGTLLSVNENAVDNIVVIKVKIHSSYSNQATIHQNYYNIEQLAEEGWYSDVVELQYWAVADMDDGSESKVISFTVPRTALDKLTSGAISGYSLGSYVTDLWVHPSLK